MVGKKPKTHEKNAKNSEKITRIIYPGALVSRVVTRAKYGVKTGRAKNLENALLL